MTVSDYVTVDNIMLQYWLLLLVLTCVEGIKIEKNVGFAELRESHGWYLLGGVSLSEGKVIISSKIELFSTLNEDKEYNMEIVLMDEQGLQIEMSQRCAQNSKNEVRTIVNKLQRQKGGNYVAKNEIYTNQRHDQFMFIVMRDCKNTLVKQYFQKGRLLIQLNILNNDSHIPQAYHKQQLASLLSVFVLAFLIRRTSIRLGKYDYDSVTFLIFIFLLLQFLAMLTSQIMLIFHTIKGNHLITLDLVKILFLSLSQTVLIYTFYNVVLGWTVRTESLIIFKYLQQKILLFLIVFASQMTAFLYQNDLMYYEWAKNISGTITTLIISVFFILILVKLKGADVKIAKLYACMLLISMLNTVAVPQFSLLLQRTTLYSYKIEVQTLEIYISTLSTILLYKNFIGPSSIYYKNCLKNKSFMD